MRTYVVSGDRFGLWLVVSCDVEKKWHALCRCDCGTERIVVKCSLVNGRSKSCGCLKAEQNRSQFTTHGMSHKAEFWIWYGMKMRCCSPQNPAFPGYGGRGITVCAEWLYDFAAFYRDMGPRPQGMTLERQNTNLGYFKANCLWASGTKQQQNTRKSKFWFVDGVRFESLGDATRVTGVARETIRCQCDGQMVNGHHYPPKANCWSERKYP